MSSPYTTRLIRLGLWTLPVAALLKLTGQFGTFNSVSYGVADRAAAQAVSSPLFFIGEFVGSVLPVVLGLFGIFALFAYLVNTSARRWATIAMVFTIVGLGLTLPALGVINYAFPAFGRAYLAGSPGAFGFVTSFFRFPQVLVLFPGLFVPVGAILFSVGIWRSGALPRWAGVLYAVTSFLVAFPLPIHILRLIAGVLGVFVGIWIAASVQRQPEAQTTSEPGEVVEAGSRAAARETTGASNL